MKKHGSLTRFAAALAAMLLLLLCLPAPASAACSTIDTDRETALTIYFGESGTGFQGAEFRIYRVADVSETAHLTLAGDFAAYPVSLNGLDSSGWRALAQTLDAYAARDNLPPLQTAETDQTGQAEFDHLHTGLYLVVGDRYELENRIYTPESFLLNLPNLDREHGAWDYDPAASCKYQSQYEPSGTKPDSSTISRKVLKVWDDDGREEQRPDEIVVQLLREGAVYDTVTLNKRNNWRYTWTGLDKRYLWQVAEKDTPEGYTVLVEQEGITFVMTNTADEDVPDTPPPQGNVPPPPDEDIPDQPPPEGGLTPPPDEPETPPNGPEPPAEPKLPQTGMLWWPVPLLACGGLALFMIGWSWRRHEEQ